MKKQSACRSGRRFFFCPLYGKSMTPGIVVSVVKGKGGFSANDLFAAGATNLAISAELFMEVWDKTDL